MEYVSEEYYRMRNNIIKYERYILKELGFCVHVQHPHKLIITCLQILELEKNKNLVQKTWNLMNDALRTNIFVRYRVETIACACIFLAARLVKIPLPNCPPWWLLLDASLRDMKAISLELLALYESPRRSLEELEKEVEVLKENLMSQKKVEIKEINVKTTAVATTPPMVKVDSPDSSSDVPTSTAAVTSKLTPSPKVSPLVTNNYRKEEKIRIYRERSPINGHKRRMSSDSPPLLEKRSKNVVDTRRRHSYSPEPVYHHRHRSPTPTIPRRYRYSGSPPEEKHHSRYSVSPREIKGKHQKRSVTPEEYYDSKRRRYSRSPAYHSDNKRSRYSLTPEHNSDSNFQPIVGPIKISSNSESDVEDVKFNGIPVQYREEHRTKRHRHKHRSEKHRHKHRERSRSHERSSQNRSRDRSHDQSRDRSHNHHKHSHHHEEREYKREVTLHHSNSIRSRDRHKLTKSDSYSYR